MYLDTHSNINAYTDTRNRLMVLHADILDVVLRWLNTFIHRHTCTEVLTHTHTSSHPLPFHTHTRAHTLTHAHTSTQSHKRSRAYPLLSTLYYQHSHGHATRPTGTEQLKFMYRFRRKVADHHTNEKN